MARNGKARQAMLKDKNKARGRSVRSAAQKTWKRAGDAVFIEIIEGMEK
jgi:hypothetical protein